MASPNNARDEEEGEEDIELEEDVEQPAPSTQKKKKKKMFGKKPKKGDADKDAETKKIKKEADQVEGLSAEEAFERYGSSEDGLTDAEAKDRLNKYGRNAIEDHHQGPIKKFLSFFYNPLAGAMWVAAIISFLATDFLDFGLIIALLVFNAAIGYWEEARAGNAIAALKAQLALKATVRRNGSDWEEIEAETLVPGDVVQLASGNVVPADCKVIGSQQLKVDQSSLTGESLPATKQPGSAVYSGSTIKQGEGEGLVYATGKNTYFGRSAGLVASTTTEGHYKQLLSAFGWFCSIFITLFVVLEIIIQFGVRNKTCGKFWHYNYCATLANLVVLIAGGVPIAMPTVLSVTMAIGAGVLAKQKAIVSRLTAVEDLASMDCLCSDKTGTLTKNKLEMDVPFLCKGGDWDLKQLLLDACLSTDYKARTMDPIDDAILKYQDRWDEINSYELLDFTPFDPVSKRTFSKVKSPNGEVFVVAKGAPQVILESATNRAQIEEDVEAKILEFAKRGFRSLGVGRLKGEAGSSEAWEMEGLIPLFDPPRDDTKATIQKAIALGVRVKMLTGDQQAIAEETARRLGMGTLIMNAKQFQNDEDTMTEEAFSEEIERYDGFSQVRPEHKFEIVAKLQERGHIVAMTGDGVNDAPALKKANIGFAVADATEAARSASDIVLTAPGLSVMITAIEGSRKIFERMKNYSTYTISVTVRVVLTFSILTFAYDWYFPTVLVLIIAILNDGTILTISKDRVKPAPLPDKWNFRELFILAFLLGFWQVISTIVLFVVIKQTNFFYNVGLRYLSNDTLRAFIYLQVSISGQATIFVTRTRGWSYLSRPAYPVIAAFVIAQMIATFLGVYGLNGFPNDGVADVHGAGWGWALCAWLWVAAWYWPMDIIKFFCQSIVFKANIPLIHPYSPEDRARDEQLEAMSKAAIEERKRLGFKDIGEDDDDLDEDVNPADPVDDDVDVAEEVDEAKIDVHTPLTTRQASGTPKGTPQIGRNTPQAGRSTPQAGRSTPQFKRNTPQTNRVPETRITPGPSSPSLSSSGNNMRRPYTQQNL